MQRGSSHSQKTLEERKNYQQFIESTNPLPTIDNDNQEFDPSNTLGETVLQQSSSEVRKPPVIDQLRDHIKKNWVSWLFIASIAIMGGFLIDSRIKNAEFAKDIEYQENQIQEIDNDLQEDFVDFEEDFNEDLTNQQTQINKIDLIIIEINEAISELKLVTNELLLRIEFIEILEGE